MYGQLISWLDKHEKLQFSREKKGERYISTLMYTNILLSLSCSMQSLKDSNLS